MKILIYTATDPAPVARALEQNGRVEVCVAGDAARFRAEIESADALILGNARYQSAADTIIALGRRLRWIQFSSSGFDALKREELRPEIAITRAVGVWTPTVAEHALALSLALLRRLPDCAAARQDRHWAHAGIADRLRSFSGLSVLVVGYGDVGRTFAVLARALGAELIAMARSARIEEGVEVRGVQSLREWLPRAGLVVLTAPGGDGPLLDAAHLALLRPSAYLVNVGRGSLIDEDALCSALGDGRIAGAGLDVTATEPLPADSPLWTAPNLIISPHVAGQGDKGAVERLAALCRRNAENLLEGRPLVGAVDALPR